TKIFDVFKRLHPEWEYGGMVIGLAIVKKIAQYHGGAVVASGTTGAGAVFKLYLPVDRREDPKADRTFMASPMV
ncbi:MAG: ATP-binding protein, partial [Psychroserpens sp.]|uniref:ATP-binding protein n=1 Tax=Psychroserpens sp. TaxID=2020870 RepID=UPI003C8094AD